MAMPTNIYVIPNAAAVMKIPASARKAISESSARWKVNPLEKIRPAFIPLRVL